MEDRLRLDDHEIRIRKLEESDVKQQIQLANIEKSQSEIKLMINEGNNKLLEALISNNTTANKIKVSDRKEFWALVSLIVGAVLAYLGLK